jgi:hypothetical protein
VRRMYFCCNNVSNDGCGGGSVDGVFFLARVICKGRWRVNYLDGENGGGGVDRRLLEDGAVFRPGWVCAFQKGRLDSLRGHLW